MSNDIVLRQNTELSNISPEIAAYLAQLDQLNIKKGFDCPTIKIVSSLKANETTKIPVGNYYKEIRGKDWKNTYEDLGRKLSMVFLRVANLYTYYDEIENKVIFKTTEYGKGITDQLVCTDSAGNIVYQGTAIGFKAWAIKNHPKIRANAQYPMSMFASRTVIYLLNPFEMKPGTAEGIYRMYMGTANNDYLWEFQNKITGNPIRYVTGITPEARDNGTNRSYVHKFEIEQELTAVSLVEAIKLKQELDLYLAGLTAETAKPKPIEDTDVPAEMPVPQSIQTPYEQVAITTRKDIDEVPLKAGPVNTGVCGIITRTAAEAIADAEDIFS